jgi:hypothetical protein
MAARLKVFVTSDGLTDYVVATTSRPKALAAWGSHQDLFKTGLAHETDDAALVRAATAQPGEVLRRPAGSREALAKLRPMRATKPKAPSKAGLKKVEALERKLAAAKAAHAKASEALEQKRLALERQAAELEARGQAETARLEEELSKARRALD